MNCQRRGGRRNHTILHSEHQESASRASTSSQVIQKGLKKGNVDSPKAQKD